MKLRQLSDSSHPIVFLMVDSNDHVTGKTGLSPTVTISKNGGSFGAVSGAVTELSSGWYALAGNSTDRNTLGALAIHATATGADSTDEQYTIVAYDPFSATSLGLTNLDTTVSSRSNHTPADVWSSGTRTLSSYGTLVADIWANGTRTLSSYGTLVSDIWANGTRTLSSYGTLVADVWANVTRTLTSGGGGSSVTPSDVWSYASRTLTQYLPVSVSPASDSITLYTYATDLVTIANVGDESEIWFTIKKDKGRADSESILQISKTGGLLYINGQTAVSAGLVSGDGIAAVVAGNLGITLKANAASQLVEYNKLYGEVKTKTAGGVVSVVSQFDVVIKNAVGHSI